MWLLALAASVFSSPMLSAFNRVKVNIVNDGPSLPVTLHIRTREANKEWYYLETNYFPRTIRTQPSQTRTVMVSVPKNLKDQTQVCVRHTPVALKDSFQLLLSYQSCANLPMQND